MNRHRKIPEVAQFVAWLTAVWLWRAAQHVMPRTQLGTAKRPFSRRLNAIAAPQCAWLARVARRSIWLWLPIAPLASPRLVSAEDTSASAPPTERIEWTSRRLCELSNRDITESSGIAPSRRKAGVFWTHNDSGDVARFFAFDAAGRDLGVFEIEGVDAIDWEDMASFTADHHHFLMFADCGNNDRQREQIVLYGIDEPDPTSPKRVPCRWKVNVRFEGPPFDCEAIAVDVQNRQILLAAKQLGLTTQIYSCQWPKNGRNVNVVARAIGTVPVPLVTAMDISSDNRRAILLTYLHAYEYTRDQNGTWRQAFRRPARMIPMPARKQGESVCYGDDNRSLYLTSEGRPSPLFEVRRTRSSWRD